MGDDIVDRLAYWRDLEPGSPDAPPANGWLQLLRATCADAATEIEMLRARVATLVIFTGAATSGPDLREIKDGQGDAMRPVRTPGGFNQAR